MERAIEKESASSSNSKPIPDSVMEAVKRTSKNIDDLSSNVDEFFSLYSADVFPEMGPLQQAQSLLLLAKATTTLFTLRLRCKGVNPDEHPVKLEFERLSLYQEKLQYLMDLNKAPLRPSATINPQAATRFIEHSLPNLTPEQRRSMREISKGEGPRIKSTYELIFRNSLLLTKPCEVHARLIVDDLFKHLLRVPAYEEDAQIVHKPCSKLLLLPLNFDEVKFDYEEYTVLSVFSYESKVAPCFAVKFVCCRRINRLEKDQLAGSFMYNSAAKTRKMFL
ncbi:hypothetical protein K7X08_020856 [Anisodus acutangulus]|uniref:Nuclear nucleic acid-binding protein C1D n=1 Tax=Anisodus acutangulus TaxID=402998 RepID=A0A9Q1MXI0_9SOLA|nr:hypothetical protein K7X08_020856 [Anisodus acutangulus]